MMRITTTIVSHSLTHTVVNHTFLLLGMSHNYFFLIHNCTIFPTQMSWSYS